MPTWAIVLIIVLVAIVLICICFSMSSTSDNVGFEKVDRQGSILNRQFTYEGTIPCYLCLNKVRNSEWDSGEHRKRCAFKNQRELLSYPQPYDAYCPNCRDRLRLWPEKGHPFYCDECPLDKRDVLKRNTGENRLNCFLCDFDVCVNCCEAERFRSVCSESGMSRRIESSTNIYFDDIERADNISRNLGTDEYEPTYNPPPYNLANSFGTRTENYTAPEPYNPLPYNHKTENYTETETSYDNPPFNQTRAETIPQSLNTPFIIPPQSNATNETPLPYSIIPPAVPSTGPSLPYPISPIQSSSPEDHAPSAPPLIKPY